MGEKIRDIAPVTLIGSELMVELNEGYAKQQGRVIHIQNKQFRFLLKEKDYYVLASNVLRAKVEFDYLKTHPDFSERYLETEKSSFDISSFTLIPQMRDMSIRYRIIDVHSSIVTMCIHPNDYNAFKNLVKKNKGRQIAHPFGKRYGYKFLYQMKEFKMFQLKGEYYEVFCQLPCLSNSHKMWIPLDRMIQSSVWNSQRELQGCSFLNEEDYWIYRLIKSLYAKKEFDAFDVEFFNQSSLSLDSETLKQKLSLIVFEYTDRLLIKLSNHEYTDLVDDYYSFSEY